MSEEKLIEAVRARRELYDTQNANYMKTKLKNRIWCEIAKELNFKDGEETKNMWLKLRGSFRDAWRRQKKCMKSGAAPEHIKPWRFQKQMSFLEPFMSTGPREGNIEDSNDNSELLSEQQRSENFESDEVECERDKDGCEERNDGEQPHISASESNSTKELSLPKPITSTPVAHKKQPMQLRQERAKRREEDRRTLLQQNSALDDPLYNFFISMYQVTKNMPSVYQHRVRGQIFQSVSEAEADIMNIPSGRSHSTLSSRDSASDTIPSRSPYPPSNPSPHPSSYSQRLTAIYHREEDTFQMHSNETNSSTLVDFINQFQ